VVDCLVGCHKSGIRVLIVLWVVRVMISIIAGEITAGYFQPDPVPRQERIRRRIHTNGVADHFIGRDPTGFV
jgi:hypothetical protein